MLRWFGALFLTLFSAQLWAAQCSAVFPGAVQGNSGGSRLTINSNGQIRNSPTTVFPFQQQTINGSNSCVTTNCSVSGSPASSFSLPSFPGNSVLDGFSYSYSSNRVLGQGFYFSDSFRNITVNGGTTSFSSNYSTYYIRNLQVNNTGILDLKPGTYWIRNLTLNSNARLNVVGSGTVKIYANTVNLNSNSVLNGVNGSANILVTVYNNMHANSDAQAEGVYYVNNNLNIDSNASITGAVSANKLTINSNGFVNYSGTIVGQTDFGNLCTGGGNSTVAKYTMEQTAWSGSGSILDTSGSNNNGTPVGGVLPEFPDSQKSCKAASIPANSLYSRQDAINTDVDINTLGNQGSIAFWYRSNQGWDQVSTSKILFDASQSNNAQFTLYHSSSRRLYFYVSGAHGQTAVFYTQQFNFAASDWVHIAVTWDANNDDFRIYVNGSAYTLFKSNFVNLNSGLANIGTLYMGDNRSTSNITNYGYSADGYIDEIHLFDYELTSAQVTTVSNDVTTCAPPEPTLLAKYELSQTSWSGSDSILDTSGNSNHASPIGSINSILPSPQISCRAVDVPLNNNETSYAIDTELDLDSTIGSKGTIAFWYKSDTDWQGSSNRKLIDASRYTGDVVVSKAFYGTLTSAGRIEFGLEGSNDNDYVVQTSVQSFKAQEWVHIAFTWDASAQVLQIYLNGQLQALSTVINQGITAPLTGLDSLYIGDNRADYRSFYNNTNGSAAGEFDEIHIYNGVVNNTTINTVMGNTTRCLVPDVFYTFDECSYQNNPFEIKDIQGNQDATPVNSIDTQSDAQVGRSVALTAFNHHATTNIQLNNSWTVSTWFKKPFVIDSGSRYHVLGSFTHGGDLMVLDNQDNFRWQMYDGSSAVGSYQFGNLSNGWHHMALVAHNGSTKLYIDGALVDTIAQHPRGALTYIGTSTDSLGSSSAQGWRAPLDEFLLFKKEISAADINSIYQNQLAGKNYDGQARGIAVCGCTASISGLRGSYFNNYVYQGTSDPFPTGSPTLIRVDNNIDFNWGWGNPAPGVNDNNFAIAWEGYVEAPVSGDYTFSTVTDDGVRLFLDKNLNGSFEVDVNSNTDERLIDHWEPQGATRRTADSVVSLSRGQRYKIRMEYFEQGGRTRATLEWRYSGGSRHVVPQQYLSTCSSAIDHYRLEHPDAGYTCADTPVIIKACNNANCTSLSNQSSTLTLGTDNGVWVNGTSVNFTGTTTQQLRNITAGSTSTIEGTSSSPTAPIRCYIGGTLSDCKVDYSAAGLVASWQSDTNPVTAIPNQESQLAFNQKLVIKTDPSASCGAGLQGRSLQVAVECNNPASCNANMFRVGNSQRVTPTDFYTYPGLTFDANSKVEIPANALRYDDAGQVKLKFRDIDSGGISRAMGASNPFVVKPTKLKLSHTTNARQIAGEAFTVRLTAVGHLGNTTPNYQSQQLDIALRKDTPATPVALTYKGRIDTSYNNTDNLNSSFIIEAESSLSFPSISKFAKQPQFNSGNADLNISYSEVGTITTDFRDRDYLGTGIISYENTALPIFIASHFEVDVTTDFSASCGTFNYFGQDFTANAATTVTLTAKNKNNATTRYYDSLGANNSAFDFELSNPLSDRLYKDKDGHEVTPDLKTVVVESERDFDGIFRFVLGQNTQGNRETFAYKKSPTPRGPLTNYVPQLQLSKASLTDKYGVGRKASASDASNSGVEVTPLFAPIELRYGRINMQNAVGSELNALPVDFAVEYYDGSLWRTNTLDDCTTYNATDISVTDVDFGSPLPTLKDLNTQKTVVDGIPSFPLNGFVFDAPAKLGTVELTWPHSSLPEYLQFDKDGNGSIDNSDAPSATATFGQFRGNDRIIHWREVFND